MRVLIVEDEQPLADALAGGLRHQGYVVETCYNGRDALDWLLDQPCDVVVLDRDLPLVHGDVVCRTLAEQGHPARILMLTAAATLPQMVDGFDLGADDYLTKPFAYLELLARIRALGRRLADAGEGLGTILERGEIRIDTRRSQAEERGRPLDLTPKELGVLTALVRAEGAYRTAMQLLDAVWDDPFDRSTDVVKVVIHGLRRKLSSPDRIESRAGFGYRVP